LVYTHTHTHLFLPCLDKNSWITILKNILKSTFKDVGKGWFNIKETNIDAYNFGKMKSYLTMIKFFMEDSLRFLTEDMLHRYTHFIERHCNAPLIKVQSINNVTCKWPDFDFSAVSIHLMSI